MECKERGYLEDPEIKYYTLEWMTVFFFTSSLNELRWMV
jgi:hypothetical protein